MLYVGYAFYRMSRWSRGDFVHYWDLESSKRSAWGCIYLDYLSYKLSYMRLNAGIGVFKAFQADQTLCHVTVGLPSAF